jgi:hypothetical protein
MSNLRVVTNGETQTVAVAEIALCILGFADL